MNDALDRVKAARMIERVRQQRASVATAGGAGGTVTVEPTSAEPCAECDEQGEILQSPDPAVADAPITAAATMVRNAIVFPSKHFDTWDADGQAQTPLTF